MVARLLSDRVRWPARRYRGVIGSRFERRIRGAIDVAASKAQGPGGGKSRVPNDWSRDGRWLLYSEISETGRASLWSLALHGVGKADRLIAADFETRQGQFSPDGRWLAYAATESTTEQICVQSFPQGGGKWQISSEGGSQPRWRTDGRELFCVDPLGKMMSVEINSGGAFEPRPPKVLFPFPGSNNFYSTFRYDVTADGKKFLILTPSEDATFDPLHVAINWTTGIKK